MRSPPPINEEAPGRQGTGPRAIRKQTPNYTANPVQEFRGAMAATGIVTPDEIIPDDRLHRFFIEGHHRGSRNGAYVLHLDGCPAGWFQDFKAGVSGTWKAGGGRWHLDDATRRQIQADRQKRQAETEARYAKTASLAREIWHRAKPCTEHHYLDKKNVQSHGLRVTDCWLKWIEGPAGWRKIVIPSALLVPLFDETCTLWNLQAIFPEVHPELGRDKDFLPGRKAGLFYPIGGETPTVRIAEGYATAATVHEATGDKTFVAFDCGNLEAVARTVRRLHPEARIVIMADDDRHTASNPGVLKARAAALAVGGLVAIPPWPEGHSGGDWNDFITWRRFTGSPETLKKGISPFHLHQGAEQS